MSDKDRVEKHEGTQGQGRFHDLIATKWLGKNLGRTIELYMTRAPKVDGILRAVDERFGRIIIETDNEEIIVYMSGVSQIRMIKDNGTSKK